MPATLHAADLGAARGPNRLFSGLTVTVASGDVWGLVGANGAGKSTLLTILASLPTTAEIDGRVTLAPPEATVGYLAQEPERRPHETLLDLLRRRTGVAQATAAMDAAAGTMADHPDDAAAADAYAVALERWLALGSADLDDRAGAVLADLGLTVDLDAPTTALSGGQAARAGLAALLLSRYDVLLLDEPTNDLDLAGLERLERFVEDNRTRTPMMVISHDREFLARTVTGVVELDRAQQQITVFDGGYEAYLAEREIARRRAREAYEEYADKLDALHERMQTQRQWVDKGVRNARRKASDGDKHIVHRNVARSEKQAGKISQTERAIERLEEVEEPRKEWELRLSIARAPRSGTVVATADSAVVRRGTFRLGPITTQIDYGDRVVLTGANGSGKSTLLALLLGRLTPDDGRVSLGSGVAVGEIDQARAAFAGDDSVAETFGRLLPGWAEAQVRTLLAKFGLGGQQALRPAASLSPGERTRAGLALLQARGTNLLVLDEPTNHLDLPAIVQLEQAVESFDGTVLLVTHDRRMLQSVRANRRWEMTAGRLTETLVSADGSR